MPEHIARMCRVEEIERLSTESLSVYLVDASQHSATPNWIDTLKDYIRDGRLLDDQKEATKVKRRGLSFEIVDGQLYKRSFGGPLLKCLLPEQANEVMDEVYGGVCSTHQGANTLSRKIILQGYY